ncbi:hypothetical protein ZPR_1339 [Zunongwangia profunda SM-A87]|uniref:Uncharacterized protein n=1 Tax=Zunongwangia profunda (strain DSM 18752 / CCTCC AB 206139 / SM-A87) TaxID=655815 RepID=D5BJK9_ZUNPS|nr:hypothetical protein ZPR_1339 [Zunongwangia profunda SM-A87]
MIKALFSSFNRKPPIARNIKEISAVAFVLIDNLCI